MVTPSILEEEIKIPRNKKDQTAPDPGKYFLTESFGGIVDTGIEVDGHQAVIAGRYDTERDGEFIKHTLKGVQILIRCSIDKGGDTIITLSGTDLNLTIQREVKYKDKKTGDFVNYYIFQRGRIK